MGQVTIYLDDEIEAKMIAAAKAMHLSKSKWITNVIREKVISEWPKSVEDLAGTWDDLPDIDEIRSGLEENSSREDF